MALLRQNLFPTVFKARRFQRADFLQNPKIFFQNFRGRIDFKPLLKPHIHNSSRRPRKKIPETRTFVSRTTINGWIGEPVE